MPTFAKWVDGSFAEIVALYDSFQPLKDQSTVATPQWDDLKKRAVARFMGE
ncbi:hypothetical protein GCM10008018_31400 [Paenibacillus marchantiophytorum]|uniref:Uncharacterized protein n=1 Tax=Paenibacillus marchantiophytorum TaxID=1619310 RepID=A0ABQ1ES64_9BACL|nr:hypothetical protein GCM10008018_31400 [Paenibacillus marchantiophytorum]